VVAMEVVAGEALGSCWGGMVEGAACGLVLLLDTSSQCGCKRSMLTGLGAMGGVRAEITQGTWAGPRVGETTTSPALVLSRGSPVLQHGPRCSSCSLVSDLLREQRWVCLSSDWGQGRLVGPLPALPWPQGQPGTHRFHRHHTAMQPSLLPLSPLPGGKSVIRPREQR
jgi:hypothetical protein